MAWPLSQDYNEAVQVPGHSFSDPDLKRAEAVTNTLGLPIPCSGNFAEVYALQDGPRKWAVKCFTRQIPGLQERYVQISKYLRQVQNPCMIDFQFLEQGIKVRGQWVPVLKMHWAEGRTLNTFVRDNLDKQQLERLIPRFHLPVLPGLEQVRRGNDDPRHRAGEGRAQRVGTFLHLARRQAHCGRCHDKQVSTQFHHDRVSEIVDNGLHIVACYSLLIEASCRRV